MTPRRLYSLRPRLVGRCSGGGGPVAFTTHREAVRSVVCATLIGLIACLDSLAATQADRLYRFGEDDLSSSGTVFDTFDSVFVDGVSFVDAQDLTAGGSSPAYVSLGGGGLNDPLPGGVGSSVAVDFGGSDFLIGAAFGNPSSTVSNTDANSPILGDYDGLQGRGMQFWARPANAGGGTAATGSTQTLISDGERHAVIIDANGLWRARYNNTFRTSTQAAAPDAWTHLMLVSPTGTTGATFYIDGVAALGFTGNYSGGTNDLFVGARTNTLGSEEFYTGAIDEVDMFVLGDNGTVSAEFRYAEDNDFFTEVFLPAQGVFYSGGADWVVGDSDFDGDVDTADVNNLIGGWLSANTVVGGVQAGDYTSIMNGDFDVDGDVDREDFFLLRQANPAAVAAVLGAGAVPEPAAGLSLACVAGFCACRRRDRRSVARANRKFKSPVRFGKLVVAAAMAWLAPSVASAQLITWDAGGDGVSAFQEANWTDIDGAAGTDPPADTVNGLTPITANLLVDGAATVGGPIGAGSTFRLDDGVTLAVRDTATFRMQPGAAIDNLGPEANANLVIEGSAAVFAQFLSNITGTLSGAADLELFGGGDPLGGNVTLDLAAGWTGGVTFTNESPADVISEHLSQITVNGSPAVFGTNVTLAPSGAGTTLLLGSAPVAPTLTIDRSTGRMVLDNNTGASLGEIVQYDVQSANGGFARDNWNSIASTGGLDESGASLGATGWFELTAAGSVSGDLSEGTLGQGLAFTNGTSLDLGAGAWLPSPFEDVRLVLQDDAGNDIEALVFYTGDEVAEGDFDADGAIDADDWAVVRDNLLTDVSSLSPISRYLSGDLTGDGSVDRLDFNDFKQLFEAQSGPGSFALLLRGQTVPEPTGLACVAIALACLAVGRRRVLPHATNAAVAACLLIILASSTPTHAQVITWDAGGDGVSTFQEANWVVTDDTGSAALAGLVGADPPADFVNPQTDVAASVVIGGDATAGGGSGGPHFDLADGFSFSVLDNATYRGRFFGTPPGGIRGVAGGAVETFTAQDSSTVFAQFLLDIEASLADSATLTFGGGGTGTFAGSTTLDLAADWVGSIEWVNFGGVSGSNIIDKITVDGAPAVEGVNIIVTDNGAGGSLLTLDTDLPDPTALSLIVDPATGLARIDGADTALSIDYYEIRSSGSQLNVGDWLSLQDQGFDGNAADDGFGWEEAGGSSAAAVAEAFLEGPNGSDASVAPSVPYAFLGALFDGGSTVTDDLSFFYQVDDALVQGNVIAGMVVAPTGVDGDYNDDGIVDSADFTVWRDNLGASVTLPNDVTPGTVTIDDYLVWASRFGQSAPPQPLQTTPEPSTLAIGLLACAFASPRWKRDVTQAD